MISILNKISAEHEIHCEDNYYLFEDENIIVGAVLDGCSTGINSHWASQTLQYCFKLYEKSFGFNEFITTFSNGWDNDVNDILSYVATTLNKAKQVLGLEDMNLLSTIVFFVYNKNTKTLYVKFVGDGVFFYKKENIWYSIENDENNIPLYLGYYCNIPEKNLFNFLETRTTYILDEVEEFAISSDGIFSFKNNKDNDEEIKITSPENYLIVDESFIKLKHELGKKFIGLRNDGWVIKDDLTVIKYKNG